MPIAQREVTHTFSRNVEILTESNPRSDILDGRKTVPAGIPVGIALTSVEREHSGINGVYYACKATIEGFDYVGFLHEDDVPCQIFECR